MSSVADRSRERERRRRILQQRARQAALRRLPRLLPDYLKMVLATLIGFGFVAWLIRRFTALDPLWVLVGIALFYSLRAGYYKLRLALDPGFTVPKCGCAGAADDRTEVVLRSAYTNLFGVPNELLAVGLYSALLAGVQLDQRMAAAVLAAVAVAAAAYLGYAMVAKIEALCATCVTIAGLNLLILWQLLA